MIEKNIWQTFKYDLDKNPDYIELCLSTWRYKNPGWSYNYLNDQDMQDFVLDNFGSDWSNLLNRKCPLPVMKTDVWRIMTLYLNGGVYADIDTICTDPLDNWVGQYEDKSFICGYESVDFLCQWCILSSKNHPALERLLHDIYEQLHTTDVRYNSVYEMTGPGIFTKSILSDIKINGNIIENNWEINHSEYFIHNKMWVVSQPDFFKFGKVVHLDGSRFLNFPEYPSWNKMDEEIKNENL